MIYRFDAFELDMDRFELRQENAAVPVEPQVFALLALLVVNNERMVSKDEINERIWGGRIVSEAVLSSRMKSARQAIGDSGKAQRLIRTIHGKGYRFVGDVVSDDSPTVPRSADTALQADGEPTAGPGSRPAVAVLPFTNMSGDLEQEYFADAITQDIITTLSKHRWLDVIARNTMFGYKGASVDIRRLADELSVGYVVEGSVRRSG
jgi:DNA-binding winged helix-turn-helix (wHTH) protein